MDRRVERRGVATRAEVLEEMEMTSSWEWLPPDVAEEVMEHIQREKGASAVFRRVCKRWRDAHDICVRHLSVNARRRVNVNASRSDLARMISRFVLRFQRVNEIDVHGGALHYFDNYDVEKWLRALAGLTALTDLNLCGCNEVSDDGLRALASLAALTIMR